ncbi:NAD(P)/FAD-dependent oxidoreductase [Tropicibacter naphthalenivorans]|uniref:Gamma-glutamylputrescine oxidoreductase n=1 Tax=Tropicibacter naphthalenivorans TaxID=441103 RepID=A0A0P1GKQ1_9RHOB|nr:FAD-binding oxidoreductase [Tropicibacter naphthalenivorans]CUH75278.1 Gamma-glutamylputrescine oxidoreductase [Tropicibacter naphthalenivorans]SMC45282.1 Glycine/D-amino acid oxidase [Tropicibacter naphthalenivorans]
MTVSETFWWDTAVEAPVEAGFDAGDCDVAIVGGGYTGLSCALHCAEAGLRAHVLEAEQVGHGGSGRNVGLVNAGLWLPPSKLLAAMGAHGPAFLEQFGDAPRQVFDLIERHQIRCEATRAGTIHAAHAPSGMRDLRARYDDWQRLGAPVQLLTADQAFERTGTRAFHGGLLDARAGTVNPMGYARGLARAAKAQGAKVSTGVRVTGLRRDGTAWIVTTAGGDLRAQNVVLAANAYSDALWPGLSNCWSDIHFFQISTTPLGAEAAHILPQGQGLWDTGLVMRSLRRDAEGRLVLGTMGRNLGGLSRAWAQRTLRQWFPELGPLTLEHGWHGRIAMTPDHLPRLLHLDSGLYAPIGYNGRGITTGTLFGRALAQHLAGGDSSALPLPLTQPQKVPFKAVQQRAYDLAFAAKQVMPF